MGPGVLNVGSANGWTLGIRCGGIEMADDGNGEEMVSRMCTSMVTAAPRPCSGAI